MPQPKPQRRSSLVEASLLSEPHTQSKQHLRSSSSSSRPVTSSPLNTKTRSAHAHSTHGPRSSSQPREISSLVRPPRSQRENAERISRASPTESQQPSHCLRSAPRNQQQTFRALRTRDIITNPRLQQVTGILPRKVDLWADRELPPEELYRLAWAMRLPEPFPAKRPRGEIQTPIIPKVKKT
ncbi:hypothetical protein F4823DRAFT_270477 [Ustulina deusta]|nr:hypothetical protein F4823DRAFT_270477 [Ustulina deusta]